MSHVDIRQDGCAGRITLNRPDALNAITLPMVEAIDAALQNWANDPSIKMLIIDAIGPRAFCAGGDIAAIYASGITGDYSLGRAFWQREYRMNARMAAFPKPVASFMQGFTMGGGVGIGCHASHRVVCENSQISMPECAIGLVPDAGGSLLLAQAPGRLGEYLAVTGARMDAADAIFAGFADYNVPQEQWAGLIACLCETGDWLQIGAAAQPVAASQLAQDQPMLDAEFGGESLADIYRGLPDTLSGPVTKSLKAMSHNSPLSMAYSLELIHRVKMRPTMANALDQEYRFTYRCMEYGDFLEGIRAAIIDKDRKPHWRHKDWQAVKGADLLRMTMPLGTEALNLEGLA
ncbi:MAG: enoyl-CoA hydratase/isomerase family protein [Rhodobacteraceae bacterium]|nr:enoyl-CoA hydratase/isomerase family protein [Paracoccaceae bacterium]